MHRTALTVFLLILAFIGIADAWYLTASALSDTALSCDLGAVLDGCNIVAKSEYSHFLGLPLAMYGVGFFVVIFILAALLMVYPHRLLHRSLFWLSAIGSAMSVVFLLVQFVLIKALCIYCIASAVITFLVFLVARDLQKQHRESNLHTVVQTT
ncbi:MAG: vitamin K epoxide reductase family protein [Candidatus Pacebacteria bacterium]|nr:vitamin K epoxide reductase family protein [Candidatus Paceibacterota bacterium]